MCILCDKGFPQNHARSQLGRRDFLKTTAAGGAAAGLGLFAARPAAARLVEGGERRLRAIVSELNTERLDEPWWSQHDPAGSWRRDIDRPADLR